MAKTVIHVEKCIRSNAPNRKRNVGIIATIRGPKITVIIVEKLGVSKPPKQALKLCDDIEIWRDSPAGMFSKETISDFEFLAEKVVPKADTLKSGLKRKAAKK